MNVKNTKYTRRRVNMGAKTWGRGSRKLSVVMSGDPFNEIAFKGGIVKILPWLAQNPLNPPPPQAINNDRSLRREWVFSRTRCKEL